jgi:hypothetical protein
MTEPAPLSVIITGQAVSVWFCEVCGAIIANVELHRAWHALTAQNASSSPS